MKKARVTLPDEESSRILDELCHLTGLSAGHLLGLMLRKYRHDLENWMGDQTIASRPSSASRQPVVKNVPPPPADDGVHLPTDPGMDLPPIKF